MTIEVGEYRWMGLDVVLVRELQPRGVAVVAGERYCGRVPVARIGELVTEADMVARGYQPLEEDELRVASSLTDRAIDAGLGMLAAYQGAARYLDEGEGDDGSDGAPEELEHDDSGILAGAYRDDDFPDEDDEGASVRVAFLPMHAATGEHVVAVHNPTAQEVTVKGRIHGPADGTGAGGVTVSPPVARPDAGTTVVVSGSSTQSVTSGEPARDPSAPRQTVATVTPPVQRPDPGVTIAVTAPVPRDD
jgi:hypothetical protein